MLKRGLIVMSVLAFSFASSGVLLPVAKASAAVDQATLSVTKTYDSMVTGWDYEFGVTITENIDTNDLVRVRITLDDPTVASKLSLGYEAVPGSAIYYDLAFNNGVAWFGPQSGFVIQDATTEMSLLFNEPGVYTARTQVIRVSDGEPVSQELVSVYNVRGFETAYLTSTLPMTLDACSGFTEFKVATVPRDQEGYMVRARTTLTGNAANIVQEYKEVQGPQAGQYLPLPFDANNQAFFGPVTGFPLMNTSSDFRIDFTAPGSYTFKIELLHVMDIDEDYEYVMGEPLEYTVNVTECDTTAPVVTVNPLTTTETSPALSGTVDDATAAVVVEIGGVTYPAQNIGDGTWTLAAGTITPALSVGNHNVKVTATDPSGNNGQATAVLTIKEAEGGKGGPNSSSNNAPAAQVTPIVTAAVINNPIVETFAEGLVQGETTDEEKNDGEASSTKTDNKDDKKDDKKEDEKKSGFNWIWVLVVVVILGGAGGYWQVRQKLED